MWLINILSARMLALPEGLSFLCDVSPSGGLYFVAYYVVAHYGSDD